MLPDGDRTPPDFALPAVTLGERFKRPLRILLYPLYGRMADAWIRRQRYAHPGFTPDFWLWGQRGNDYAALRRRVNRLNSLRDRRLMIAGCGTGRDILSWLAYSPRSLVGVDYFNYASAWAQLREHARRHYPETDLALEQGDLQNLDSIAAASIDVVGSDAVLEHLHDLPKVLREFFRILRPGGVLYATFGPLWYCWGGDHISGYDRLSSGYNHLLLESAAYEAYLSAAGPRQHCEHDGRTWIDNDLFSRLRPVEYVAALDNAGFERRAVGAIVEPRAVRCLAQFGEIRDQLFARYRLPDLVITGMTIVYRKPRHSA